MTRLTGSPPPPGPEVGAERAKLGEEVLDIGYLPSDADHLRENIGRFRETADALEREGVRRMPDERALALRRWPPSVTFSRR